MSCFLCIGPIHWLSLKVVDCLVFSYSDLRRRLTHRQNKRQHNNCWSHLDHIWTKYSNQSISPFTGFVSSHRCLSLSSNRLKYMKIFLSSNSLPFLRNTFVLNFFCCYSSNSDHLWYHFNWNSLLLMPIIWDKCLSSVVIIFLVSLKIDNQFVNYCQIFSSHK